MILDRLHRVLALVLKEFLTILKDPKSRFVVIGPPIIQFFVFGYAATFDVTSVRYAVLDESRTPESRALLARFESSASFDLVATLDTDEQIARSIDAQAVRLVLHVGPTYAENLHAGRPAVVQAILDGRNSNVASIALGYVQAIVQQHSASLGVGSPIEVDPGLSIDLVDRAWYNPNLTSRWYIVSALGGTISMVVVMLLTSLSIAREREQGTFDQLLVSPLTPLEILVGKATPAVVFGLADAALLSAGAVLWFEVPLLGSLAALLLGLFVFVIAVTGVGLFISSLSGTMQQGLLGSFMYIMPSVILSGFTTPLENMPRWLQVLTFVNPLRYVVELLRRVFLEAASLQDVAGLIFPMLAIAAVTLALAAFFFRWRTT
ncbi:MAG: ABC transporter permease [Phycisphaerales bacterium]|nr:ABC transporter permease [Phycisphaerales bacterium]